MNQGVFDVAVIGCGSTGIATAYYLARNHGITNIALIDRGAPMAFTSAHSGENYRNWWPHPTMVDFTDRSIDLLEVLALESGNRINLTRRGYALVTREASVDGLIEELQTGLGDRAETQLRFHDDAAGRHYRRATPRSWEQAPNGVDILRNPSLIRTVLPSYSYDTRNVVHIRRGGDLSAQQLGALMLEHLHGAGARRIDGTVVDIENHAPFEIALEGEAGRTVIEAETLVNAAGPFAGHVAHMMGIALPLQNVFQQKLAIEDGRGAIPRDMPFSIDLDPIEIAWSDEERELLRESPDFARFTESMPGAIHCRPEGGEHGTWIKMGWAYNETPAEPTWEPPLDTTFPEIVLRGASRLNPSLEAYIGRLPRRTHHYGGWYTMTEENWPLIGPMGPDGTYMNCGLSGYGTMTACAGGELCAAWVAQARLPGYAKEFSLARYDDPELMAVLHAANRGIL